MSAIKRFFRTTLIGGVIVVLPVAILIGVFAWIWQKIEGLIAKPAHAVANWLRDLQGGEILPDADPGTLETLLAQIIVLLIIVASCFLIGLGVKTAFGNFIHRTVEDRMLRRLPGYSLVKETILQFIGDKESPFSSVALCRIFGNDTLVTAFVTDKHENGMFTVFIPTGPNPTSGNIYHLKPEFVHPVNLPVEDVMRSIISCGAGSTSLVKAIENQMLPDAPPADDATPPSATA